MFLNFCHALNGVPGGSRIVALLRFILFVLLFKLLRLGRHWEYSTPANVAGYRGGVDVPMFGCLTFIRADGTRQYRW